MAEIIEEYYLSKAVNAALASGEKPVKVSLDEIWVRILLSVKKEAFIKNLKYLLSNLLIIEKLTIRKRVNL